MLESSYTQQVRFHFTKGTLPEVECYVKEINQVLLNVISNAIEAVDGQGDIWIDTRLDQDTPPGIAIEVKDNGAGIDKNIQSKIFDPFFTTKPVGKGTGLGLAMAYSIMQKHEGAIAVEKCAGQRREIYHHPSGQTTRMIRSCVLFATLVFIQAGIFAQIPYSPKRLDSLKTEIEAILAKPLMQRSDVGVYAKSLHGGQALFSRAADTKRSTASCLKLLTTATALRRWGPAHTFKTDFLHDGEIENGILKGNLYIKGYGDPYFVTEILFKTINHLYAGGLQEIRGNLVFDDSYLADVRNAETNDRAYSAIGGALAFNFNTVVVNIRPGRHVGDPAIVFSEPRSKFFKIINNARTLSIGKGNNLGHHNIHMSFAENYNTIQVNGGIAVDAQEVSIYKRVSQPARFYATVMRETLGLFGINVTGKTVFKAVPQGLKLLYEVPSFDLTYIIAGVNKWSNNFVAGQLLMIMGAEEYGVPGTDIKGIEVLKQTLDSIGIKPGAYHIVDGSGLDVRNKMTPAAMVRILDFMQRDFRYAPEYVSSLSIAGVDGTGEKTV